MSSSGRRHRDLIERSKYPNPLPLPPYAPKLIKIETPTSRYGEGPETQTDAGGNAGLRLTSRLAQANQLPVLVDAEAGMPLDLTLFPGVWSGDMSAIAPRHAVSLEGVEVDPEDAFLLGPLTTALPPSAPASAAHVTTYHTPGVNGAAAGSSQAGLGPGMPARTTQADVSWLRRTEYLAQDAQRDLKSREMGPEKLQVDTSREAEVARIEAAFDKVQRQPLSQIQHPTKPHLKAVKSWDLLPDVDTWSTQYQVVRFVDWPGRSKDGKAIPDPRVSSAVLRPVTAGNEQRISYYLISPEDEEELTANAIAGAKERLGAEEEEDEDMFGDDDEDGEVAATRKRKREAAKEAQIEKSVLQKKQEAEKVLAEKYEKRRRTGEVAPDSVPTDDPEEGLQIPDEALTNFKIVRDYNIGEQDATMASRQFILSLDNGDGLPVQSSYERNWRSEKTAQLNGKDPRPPSTSGKAAAYWHPISMRYTLRQKRLKRKESRHYDGMWDRIRLATRVPNEDEIKKRWRNRIKVDEIDERLVEQLAEEAEADDEDADADGEADADADADMQDADADADAEAADGAESEAEKGDAKGGSDDEDDEDDDDEDVESIDADEELAALRDEAEGQDDDAPTEGRRRRTAAPVADAAKGEGDEEEEDDDS